MGTLYLVATPIGNLQDITLRAIKTLFTVDVIACEDTRRAGLLLNAISQQRASLAQTTESPMHPRLLSYYEENEFRRIPEIIALLQSGKNVAVISDAGTPAISDPGFRLIRECIAQKIPVEAIPGPSSVITSLIVSGLPTDKFLFAGYPPRKGGHRMTFFTNIKQSQEFIKSTIILFEAPHRIVKTLAELQQVFGDVLVILCRELTKVHQEVRREKISQSLEHFKKVKPKGEFVILLNLSTLE